MSTERELMILRVYDYAKFAWAMPNGCHDQIVNNCIGGAEIPGGYKNYSEGHILTPYAAHNPSIDTACSEAADMCRDNVESPYYYFSGRGVYDIRHTYLDPTPPEYFKYYLNQGYVQDALGVSVNYTEANNDIYWAFQATGDFIYPNFRADLEKIIASGVRVSLYYGDADYICNWFGGQAVSLAVDYEHSKEFAASGYQKLMYGGVEYGEVREYGNFSFTRVYESGHEVPYYQRKCSLITYSLRTISETANDFNSTSVACNLQSNSRHGRYRYRHEGRHSETRQHGAEVCHAYELVLAFAVEAFEAVYQQPGRTLPYRG